MVDKKNKGGISLVLRCSTTIRRNSTCTFYAKLRRSKRDDLWYICQGFNRNHSCGGDGSNKMRNLAHMLNLWAIDRARRRDKYKLPDAIAVKYLKDGENALKLIFKDHAEPQIGKSDGTSSTTKQQGTSVKEELESMRPKMQLPQLVCVSSCEISLCNDTSIKPLDIGMMIPASSTSTFVGASRPTRISVSTMS